MRQYVIFEDETVSNFNPLVYFRPVYDLRVGIFTFREKAERLFDIKFDLHSRDFLTDLLREENPEIKVNEYYGDEILFVNGRSIFTQETVDKIKSEKNEKLFVNENTIVAALLKKETYLDFIQNKTGISFLELRGKVNETEIDVEVYSYIWNLIYANGKEIENDAKYFFDKRNNSINKNNEGVWFIEKKKIFIGENVKIAPTVVIDASDGVVIIDDDAEIMPQSVIQGPTYIGKNSVVKIGAKIYHETTIGEISKVGGEIENSILHSYSNKQHDGFLGHAYLGQWVNLGAATNNSDLKNNYAKISVKHNGKTIDTGLQFLGLIMGDHSKTAIGTLFNTGTIVGVSSNIFGAGFPPRAIPSFAWGGADFIKEYKLEKALEVADIVMERRNKKLTDALKKVFTDVFEMTNHERAPFKKK